MTTVIRPNNNRDRVPEKLVRRNGEISAINAVIRGTSGTTITYDPGSAIRFTGLQYIRNAYARESHKEAINADGDTFTTGNGFAHFKLPRGTYVATLIFNGANAPVSGGFELQENGVSQGGGFFVGGAAGENSVDQIIFDIDKPFSVLRLVPLETTTITLTTTTPKMMVLSIVQVGELTRNSQTN